MYYLPYHKKNICMYITSRISCIGMKFINGRIGFGNLFFGWPHMSGDSWMYPYQRTPMGNPYISPIYPYIVGVYGLLSPRIPI